MRKIIIVESDRKIVGFCMYQDVYRIHITSYINNTGAACTWRDGGCAKQRIIRR